MLYSFSCNQKTIKNRVHEIIRTSSLSIIFVEFSFKPVYPTTVVKFMENYNSWKNYLQVKYDSRYFYPYATTAPIPPITLSPIHPYHPFTLSQLSSSFYNHLSGDHDLFIFYMICNFFNVMAFKYIAFCHIAW